MKRIWGTVGSAIAIVAGCTLFIPACNHPDASLFVVGIEAPPAPHALDQSCVYPAADPTTTTLGVGLLDVAVAKSYTAVVLVGNQISSQADPTDDRAETSRVTINKLTVHVTDSLDNGIGDYTTQTDAFIDVGTSGTPGYGLVTADLLAGGALADVTAAAQAAPYSTIRVITNFSFTGTTLGDTDVTSNSYSFPIDVCYGCLIDFADAPGPNGTCDTGTATTTNEPCVMGQDQSFSCTLCADLTICQVQGAALDGGTKTDGGP